MTQDEIVKFESKWKEIHTEGIQKIFRISRRKKKEDCESFDLKEFLKLYNTVHDICISKDTNVRLNCYERIIEVMRDYCNSLYEEIKLLQAHEDFFQFVQGWIAFDDVVLRWTLKIFSFLTRTGVKVRKNFNLDKDLKVLFRTQIFDKMQEELLKSFLELIDRHRDGSHIDLVILREFVKFLQSIEVTYMESLYNSEFETRISESAVKYYKLHIPENFQLKFVDYLLWGMKILEREEETLSIFLPSTSVELVIKNLKEILFFSHCKELLESTEGLKFLLVNKNLQTLGKTFDIFSQDPKCLNIMITIFKAYLKEEFTNIIQKYESFGLQPDNPLEIIWKTNYVTEFFEFQKINMCVILQCFRNSHSFSVIFKEIIESIQANYVNYNMSYVLPFYLDRYLKRVNSGNQNLNNTPTETNKIIEDMMTVFILLPDKDVFIHIHRNLLCKRILFEDFISMDTEKHLITKLKLQCGVEYTSNVEGMINDYYMNKDFNERYRLWLKENSSSYQSKVQSYFSVISDEYWPMLNCKGLKIPSEIKSEMDTFGVYYNQTLPKRVLKFSFSNSTCEVDAKLNDRTYTIACNVLQAVILLTFNQLKYTETSFEKLLAMTGIEQMKDFRGAIEPLISARVLLRTEGDVIKLNEAFVFNGRRLRINFITYKDDFIKKEKIEEDRAWAIDATIIRIMKASKKINHHDLIRKVIEQLEEFRIQIQAVKKRIDNLIDKDFIRRDKDDTDCYVYSAN